MADKVQAGDWRAHEKDARQKAGVFEIPLAGTARLGAGVADRAAVVGAGGIGFGGTGVELLELRADPPGRRRLRVIGQRTDSLLFDVSRAGLQRRKRDSNPVIRRSKLRIKLCFMRHSGLRAAWRPEPESNRRARICSPLRNHSAIGPPGASVPRRAVKSTSFWMSVPGRACPLSDAAGAQRRGGGPARAAGTSLADRRPCPDYTLGLQEPYR
jgi:hypothetical protein